MKMLIIILLIVLIAGATAFSFNAITSYISSKKSVTRDISPSFKQCSSQFVFTCAPVTVGIVSSDPNYTIPRVCGCAPRVCPQGTYLVVRGATGTWPDGSSNGTFICSTILPA